MSKSTKIIIAILVAILLAYGIGMLFTTNPTPNSGPATSSVVPGQEIPPVTGYVSDGAGVLDATTKASLTTKLENYAKSDNGELAIVTVKSLNGLSIEEYGIRVGEAWKVGKTGNDNGLIIIVSSGDRKVRIEVGRGANVTDAQAAAILNEVMIPKLKAGDWAGAITGGADALIKLTSK